MAGEEYEKVVQISENEADIKSNGDADDDKYHIFTVLSPEHVAT